MDRWVEQGLSLVSPLLVTALPVTCRMSSGKALYSLGQFPHLVKRVMDLQSSQGLCLEILSEVMEPSLLNHVALGVAPWASQARHVLLEEKLP